jgi:predicted dehydrogenase
MAPEMGPPETMIWEYPMADDSWEYEFSEFLNDIEANIPSKPGLQDAIENLKIINKIYKDSGYDYNT